MRVDPAGVGDVQAVATSVATEPLHEWDLDIDDDRRRVGAGAGRLVREQACADRAEPEHHEPALAAEPHRGHPGLVSPRSSSAPHWSTARIAGSLSCG